MTLTIKEALNRPGVIIDRWVLRLGKDGDEAGKFEPLHLSPETLPTDFAGFLACLELTKLIESVSTRMSARKKGVRAIKKQQRAEDKEIAKMKAKVEKAAAKAQLKLDRAVEKERIKADAKAARELAKHLHKPRLLVSSGVEDVCGVEALHDRGLGDQASTVAPEALPEIAEVVVQVVHDSTEGELQSSPERNHASSEYEEAPVIKTPFTVPEEG